MAENKVLHESICGPEIYESLDESLGGPQIWEPSSGEESGHLESEDEIEQNPHDVTILVGDEEPRKFNLNRFVCKISSPEIRKILQEPPKAENYYVIRNISPEDFQILVDHMFLKTLWIFSDLAAALSLVESAGKLQLFSFQEEIFAQLRQLVNEEREILSDYAVFKAFTLFKEFDLRDGTMTRVAREYILENAGDLLEQDGFLELSAINFEEFLEDDNLSVESELQIFRAVIRWGVHLFQSESKIFTLENLKEVVSPLTELIRFENMSELEIRQYVHPLNVVPASAQEKYFRKRSNLCGKQRNYWAKKCEDDKMKKLINEALQSAEAKQFISCLKLEMQMYNERLKHDEQAKTNRKLEAKVVELEKQLQEQKSCSKIMEIDFTSKVEKLEKRFLIQESDSQRAKQEIMAKVESQLVKLVNVEKSLTEVATKQSNSKDDIFDLLSTKNFQLLLTAARFENTKQLAVAILFENKTMTTFELNENYKRYSDIVEYQNVPAKIYPQQTRVLGLTGVEELLGFVSYKIGNDLFIIRYEIFQFNYDVAIVLCPANKVAGGIDLFYISGFSYIWSSADCTYHRLTSRHAGQDLNVAVKLGKLQASVMMETGNKSLLRVRISEI